MVAVVTLAYVVFALDAVDVAESHLKVIIDDRKGIHEITFFVKFDNIFSRLFLT
jgi:hypothetical protein